MTTNYAYTPAIWPPFLAVIFLILLGIYSGRRRSVPGALPFAIGSLIAALWVGAAVLETAALDMQTEIFWFKVQAATTVPVVTAITCFVLDYAWPGRWLTRRNVVLLAIPCLLALLFIAIPDLQRLVWGRFLYDEVLIPIRNPVNLIYIVYVYGLTAANLIILAWLFLHSPQHRWPVAIMIVGMFGARMIYLLNALQTLPTDLPYNTPPVAFEYLMYAVALFGFHLFDPIPLARQTAIEQMHTGMLVLDTEEGIVSLNQAALDIFGLPAKRMIGRTIQEMLPTCTDLPGWLHAAGPTSVEIGLGGEAERRYYQCEASILKDWRGLAVGRLVLLQDVTSQKQAQAQLLEKQRALAILHEREQLARELHDDLSQVLAFISMQGLVVQQLLDGGEVGKAGSYVARLVEAADEVNTDIRESILSLQAPSNEQGLVPALQDYLQRYERRYGLHTEILLPDDVLDRAFNPVAEVQIMRILQEGLTNARKHAEAQCVQMAFIRQDGRIQITMRDDGKGFEPGVFQDDRPRGFGLQFMRERAEAIGGSLEVRSVPGAGTEILLIVPLNDTHA